MNAAFKPKGRRIREVKVPTEKGEWVKRTTSTRDPVIARRMHRMVTTLGPVEKAAWDVLSLVTSSPPVLPLSELWKRWCATPGRTAPDGTPIEPSDDERLAYVRLTLVQGDARKLLATWHGVLLGPAGGKKRAISRDTAEHYRASIELFFAHALDVDEESDEDDEPLPVPLACFTERELRIWIEEMDDVAPATVRKRGMGMRRFCAWLASRGMLGVSPMRDVPLPAQSDPLCHYIDTPDAIRLADASPGQMRLLEASIAGSAMELSTALAVRVRAVSKDTKSIHAPGTKTYTRDRIVRVADWAWPAVKEAMKGKHKDSLLFDEIPHRWHARDVHTETIQALAEQGHRIFVEYNGRPKLYTLRDHRHTWAVRAARTGWPIEMIARQLGHKDGVLALKVYGRFVPKQEEIDRLERLSTARDRQVIREEKRHA